MILQALNECYGALAKRGEISLPGWCDAKVSYALDIDEQGALVVQFSHQVIEHVNAGEVSIRGMYGYV